VFISQWHAMLKKKKKIPKDKNEMMQCKTCKQFLIWTKERKGKNKSSNVP